MVFSFIFEKSIADFIGMEGDFVLVTGASFSKKDGKPAPKRAAVTGFASPARDYIESELSLSEYLEINNLTTFYFKASGKALEGFGISHGDLLIVETRMMPRNDDLGIFKLEGEYVVRRIEVAGGQGFLHSAELKTEPVRMGEDIQCFGVVRSFIPKLQ